MKRLVTPLLTFAALTISANAAKARDPWLNGTPIPDWVRRECCDQADAHHLRPGYVLPKQGCGYAVDGIKKAQLP